MNMFEAVGHLTWDVNDGRAQTPGGSVGFAARTWRGLGARAHIVTAVGSDGPDEPAARVASAAALETTRFDNRYSPRGDRVQRLLGQAGPVCPRHRPADWGVPAVRFLAPVLGEVSAPAWLALPAGLKAVGLQGWLKRAAGGRVIHGPGGVAPDQFRGADVACLSEEDLAGDSAWLDALRAVVPVVVLTRGAAGCRLYTAGATCDVPAERVTALDPTGAGDTFAAGFLWALAHHDDLQTAAALGARAAALVVARVGPAPPRAFRALAERLWRDRWAG